MKKILIMLLALALVGCSSSTSSTSNSSDEFPITIKHAFGETKIESEPKNIATVGWENGDTPLALGIAPVGISRSNYGAESKNHIHNWTQKAFDKLKKKANVFDDVDGFDYEAIANSEPDVILASYSGMSEEEYKKLSKIAPTIPYKNNPWQTSWRDQTIENATALGKKKEAEKLVKDTEKLISDKVSKYSALKDKTAAFLWLDASDLSKFYIYLKQDPRAAYLTDFNLQLPESVNKLSNGSKDFSITVTREQANQLSDLDIIVTYGDDKLVEALKNDPIFSNLKAVKNNSVVVIDSTSDLAAGSTPSILSIPYNIDEYLNLLNKAVS